MNNDNDEMKPPPEPKAVNKYTAGIKVFPNTVPSKDANGDPSKDMTIGNIKIVYNSNTDLVSAYDQVDYYLMEMAKYLNWLTANGINDDKINVEDFLKFEKNSMHYVLPVSQTGKIGGKRTKRRRPNKSHVKHKQSQKRTKRIIGRTHTK